MCSSGWLAPRARSAEMAFFRADPRAKIFTALLCVVVAFTLSGVYLVVGQLIGGLVDLGFRDNLSHGRAAEQGSPTTDRTVVPGSRAYSLEWMRDGGAAMMREIHALKSELHEVRSELRREQAAGDSAIKQRMVAAELKQMAVHVDRTGKLQEDLVGLEQRHAEKLEELERGLKDEQRLSKANVAAAEARLVDQWHQRAFSRATTVAHDETKQRRDTPPPPSPPPSTPTLPPFVMPSRLLDRVPLPLLPGLDPPVPFTDSSILNIRSLFNDTVLIHGVAVTYAVRHYADIALVRAHIRRELGVYALLKDAIAAAASGMRQRQTPLVMDVGANHGIFALFAATLGAHVVALEPQRSLCAVILAASRMNGEVVAKRISLYNYAALDAREMISLARADVAEGAIATVVRSGAATVSNETVRQRRLGHGNLSVLPSPLPPTISTATVAAATATAIPVAATTVSAAANDSASSATQKAVHDAASVTASTNATAALAAAEADKESVEARPISDFAPGPSTIASDTNGSSASIRICFMKIDVEGFELNALRSSFSLLGGIGDPLGSGDNPSEGGASLQRLGAARVENIVVEWGPPSRWAVAKQTSADANAVLATLHDRYLFEPRLIDSIVWDTFAREWHKAQPKLQPLPPSAIEFGEAQRVVGVAVPIAGPAERALLLAAMEGGPQMNGFSGREAYLWFAHGGAEDTGASSYGGGNGTMGSFPTFAAGCPTRVRSGVYGCL